MLLSLLCFAQTATINRKRFHAFGENTVAQPVVVTNAPFGTVRTGLWLPSKEEITTLTERGRYAPFEFMCENYNWGSVTLRSLDCAKFLREITRIQRPGRRGTALLHIDVASPFPDPPNMFVMM